jgi:hypothetical protein
MGKDNQSQKPPNEGVFSKAVKIVTGIAAILGLIYLIFPVIKPTVPPEPDAKINAIALERDIALETYLQRNNLPAPDGFTCVEFMSNGMLIKPTIELIGLKDRIVQLRWSMYEAASDRLVP